MESVLHYDNARYGVSDGVTHEKIVFRAAGRTLIYQLELGIKGVV
jgi:hypothetical protein